MPTNIAPEVQTAMRTAANVEPQKVPSSNLAPSEKFLLKAFAEKYYAKKGQEAIFMLATGFKYKQEWQTTAQNQTQTDFNPLTGDRQPRNNTEVLNMGEVFTKTNVFLELLSKKYDRLQPHEQTRLQGYVRSFVKGNTALQEVYQDASGTVPVATLEGILRDQEYVNKLADRLNQIYDPAHLPDAEDAALMIAKNDFGSKDQTFWTLHSQLTTAQGKEQFERGRQMNFDVNPQKKQTLEILETKNPEVLAYKLKLEELEVAQQQQRLNPKASNIQTRIDTLKLEIRTSEANDQPVKDYRQLSSEKADIALQLAAAQKDVAALTKSLDEARKERGNAKVLLETKEKQRTGLSTRFVENINTAIEDSIGEALLLRAKDIIAKTPDYTAELTQEVHAEANKKIQEQLDKRWMVQKDKRKWVFLKYSQWEFDITKVADDQKTIENAGHPDDYIKKVLEAAYTTTTTTHPPTTTIDHARVSLLMGDPQFMQAQRVDMVKKLLVAQAAAKGKPSDLMLNMLAVLPWGKEVSHAWLSQADEKTKAAVTKITGKPVDANSLEDLLTKRGPRGVLRALLLAFGLVTGASEVLK